MGFTPAPGGRGTLIEVKVVPGASHSRIMGTYGDALRIQVTAPPERGRANEAACELLANALSVARSEVLVVHGLGAARKTILIARLTPKEVARRLGVEMPPG